jgi:RNA polymerase sigma factor (sigma-70 family)
MRPRQHLTELFSTFLQFESDYATRWLTDPRLRRQMQTCLNTTQAGNQQSPEYWALYWHHGWQEVKTAAELHLSAYLQEPCYWSAQQATRRFTDLQYRLPDCFQIAIAEVATVLKGFKPERGASLKTYAGIAFASLLRDALRQRQVVDLSSDWALLRRVSKKRLLEALHKAGVAEALLPQYRLAWSCFQTRYVPKVPGAKLPKPDAEFWQAVAQLYQQEAPAVSSSTLEKWLTQMGQWVRAYLYPPVSSLNAPKFTSSSGDEVGEIQDSLTDSSADLLNDLVATEDQTERSQQQQQLSQTLQQTITQLDTQSQEILRLYYQQGKTQQQIMADLALSQSSVSRRLSKTRETLLAALVQWSQSLNIPTTPTLIKDMSSALDEWLSAQYQTAPPG